MTLSIDFYSIERHIINKANMQNYILILPDMIKQPLYLIEFHLTEDELTELFTLMGFVRTEDHSYTYTNNRGCNVLLNFGLVDCELKDYYVFYEVKFIQNTIYPEGYRFNYNQVGMPVRVVYHNKNVLKGLRLMAIDYYGDIENLQIKKIVYRFEDGRKYQKCIKGTIYTITETPIKRINDDGVIFENVNIYDVIYLRLNRREYSELALSDIIRYCEFSSSKLIGTDYTQFLQMYKMFNKREQDIIAMAYV